MSSFFSRVAGQEMSALINPFTYQDVLLGEMRSAVSPLADPEELMDACEAESYVSSRELDELLSTARAEAAAEAEKKLELEMEERLAKEAALIQEAIEAFSKERKQYFARVESEVIQLSLAIAAKILHREAQADPMVIAAMVRITLDKLQDGSFVSIRVPSAEVERWREYVKRVPHGVTAEVVGDPQAGSMGCVLETNLGAVDFSIDAQLKEVEQGFFDLLAQRPVVA